MESNNDSTQQPDRTTTHYAVSVELFAAIAKVIAAQPFAEVESVMAGIKACQSLSIAPRESVPDTTEEV